MASSGAKLAGVLPGIPGAPGAAVTVANHGNAIAAANAPLAVGLAGVAGKTTYLSFAMFTVGIATAAVELLCTITGLSGGTWSFQVVGQVSAESPLVLPLPELLAASAVNTSIIANIPATGATGPSCAIAIMGFQL